ncbi:MAG: DNA-directed RNA polymerase subunit A'' [Nanoarchaeota archaeon]
MEEIIMPEHLRAEVEEQAKKFKLSEKEKKEAIKRVAELYENSCISPGEAIGIVTAESIGEPSTQMVISSFHFAGVSEMNTTAGLTRLIEVFDARKNPSTPIMKLYLKPKYSRTVEMVKEVAMRAKESKLVDVSSEVAINLAKNSVEITIDRKKLRELELKYQEVLTKIAESLKGVDVKDNEKDTIILKYKEKEIPLSEVYKLKERAKAVHLKGLKGIAHVLPVKEGEEFVIHCAGSNLKDALNMEEIDTERVVTNNIFEIADVLGIEAARAAIIDEAYKVISKQGIDIDIRHLILLADVMTRTGAIKGVTRTGITGEKESVIARASFETPIKHIIEASLTGEKDELLSVLENLMLNQPIPVGTGLPGLVAKVKEGKEDE